MRNLLRTNREINPSIMPAGWKGEKTCTCFTVYLALRERASFMARFAAFRNRIYKSEYVGYAISNYIAFHQGKPYEPLAMEILKYGKAYTIPKSGYVNYSIGSMSLTFHQVVRRSLTQLPIKKANALLYYAISAFYYAPDNLIDRLCNAINRLKYPYAIKYNRLVLQTELPDDVFYRIKQYAGETGMTVSELMRTVLRTVCVSKKKRAEDCSPFARLFNLYRIIKQPSHTFPGSNGAILSIPILDERDRYYLLKFIKRRGLSRKELLRKAVRALIYVFSHKTRFEKRIQYVSEREIDEGDYYYERLAKMDFARSLYY